MTTPEIFDQEFLELQKQAEHLYDECIRPFDVNNFKPLSEEELKLIDAYVSQCVEKVRKLTHRSLL